MTTECPHHWIVTKPGESLWRYCPVCDSDPQYFDDDEKEWKTIYEDNQPERLGFKKYLLEDDPFVTLIREWEFAQKVNKVLE